VRKHLQLSNYHWFFKLKGQFLRKNAETRGNPASSLGV